MKVSVPVEVKSRDLRGMVWLSLRILERDDNNKICIGETASIRDGLDIIKPDIYIQPGLSGIEQNIKSCEYITKAGGCVLVIETEGGVFTNDNYFRENLVHKKNLEMSNIYFSWGQKQAEIVERVGSGDTEVCISGHPRFDLLHKKLRGIYRDQAEQYQNKYGSYILVNTNFTAINRAGEYSTEYSADRIEYGEKILHEYTEMIENLHSDFTDYSIIIRPHPMEDLSYYRNRLSDLNDVHVLREGNVRPWMLGADTVVHKSSTSGIESALLETPVISYRPIKSEKYDADLPIAVSDEQTDYEGLRQAIANYIDTRDYSLNRSQRAELRKYFHDINNEYAADIITESVESITIDDPVNINSFNPPLKQRLKRLGIKYIGTSTTEKIGELILQSDFSNTRQKVPEITKQDLRTEIAIIRKHTNIDIPEPDITKEEKLSNTFLISID